MSTKTSFPEDLLKTAQAETEKNYHEYQQRCEKLRKYNKPLLHFIFTLNIHEGSFLNLESIEDWDKFINLHTMLFNKFFYCKILSPEKERSGDTIIPEQFLMRHVIESGSFGSIRTCTYKGVKFDVWTNGKDFEIIIDPTEKYLDLKFNRGDCYKLQKFFACWAGEALVKTLQLDKFVDQRLIRDETEGIFGYESIYDAVLDLHFTSFIVYTFPKDTKFEKVIERFPVSKISENMWINNGAFLGDRRFYPPFHDCFVYILGHSYEDYPLETLEYLRILYRHMRYWSMIFTIENFLGIISSFSDTPDFYDLRVKKLDALKSLLGKERNHQYISFLRKMRSDLNSFLYFGLKSDHRGLEEDVSEQYTPRYIAGEYLSLFEDDKIEVTKNVIKKANKDFVDELKKDLHNLWSDLERRIENFIDKSRSHEKAFYQEYQLRLSEKTQELTLLSILMAIIVFLASKLPLNYIIDKILSLWDFLIAILPPF